MDATLIKALVLLAPMSLLLAWSLTLLIRTRSAASLLQLVGAACLTVVGLASDSRSSTPHRTEVLQ
jgi:hypothetical protein